MQHHTQIDNPTHYNAIRERKKALEALAKAKKIVKKAIKIDKSCSADFEKLKQKTTKNHD